MKDASKVTLTEYLVDVVSKGVCNCLPAFVTADDKLFKRSHDRTRTQMHDESFTVTIRQLNHLYIF